MTATAVDPRVKEFTSRRWHLLIDGKWVKAKSEQTFQTHNPATGELLAECAQADEVDIDRAVRAARLAFESGPGPAMTATERGRLIWRLGDLVLEHLEELAELETLDNGKPIDAALPFGGYKQSGWGREMGHEVLNLYTQIKSVCIRL